MGNFKADAKCKESYNYFKKYIKMMRKTDGVMVHIYKQVDENEGRYFSGTSIQGRPKYIRGYLLHDDTTDIDMVNAHPAILLYLCKLHNAPHANLEKYVANRKSILEKGSATKEDYLKAVNRQMILIALCQKYRENKNFKQKLTCECGSIICIGAKSLHLKSKKHQLFLQNQNLNITTV